MSALDKDQMLYEVYVATQNLKERMDSHGQKLDSIGETQHRDKAELYEKIQNVEKNLLKEIGQVKVDNAKTEGATNAKIAGISGGIATLITLLSHWLKAKLGQN